MNELQKKWIEDSQSYLVHYNHNHDKLGRFARALGGVSSAAGRKMGSLFDIGNKVQQKTAHKEYEARRKAYKRAYHEYQKAYEAYNKKGNVRQLLPIDNQRDWNKQVAINRLLRARLDRAHDKLIKAQSMLQAAEERDNTVWWR